MGGKGTDKLKDRGNVFVRQRGSRLEQYFCEDGRMHGRRINTLASVGKATGYVSTSGTVARTVESRPRCHDLL